MGIGTGVGPEHHKNISYIQLYILSKVKSDQN